MTEQYKCQSYYDDDSILKDCTCGKCGNTPDTEWEKKIQELKSLFIELEISLSIQETAKIALCIREVESLLSSRDTYWEWEVEKAKKEQRERDAYLIRTSGWHTAEKLARKIFGGKQVNWYTDKQMEGAREQVREERDTHWKERVQKEVEGMKVWFMEEDYCNTFPLISKEDLLDNLK